MEAALGVAENDLSAVAGLLEKSRLKAAPTEEERLWEFDAFRVSSFCAVWGVFLNWEKYR